MTHGSGTITPPDADVAAAARGRLDALAVPAGSLGHLGDLGVWLAACQGRVPPAPPRDVRLTVFAGDHGVAAYGVSAYPASVTGAMVATLREGRAAVSALARAHDVAVRVVDVSVDSPEAGGTKVRRGSGAIHLEDALSAEELQRALAVGEAVAREEIAAGADLLLSGDLGIGHTTPAAALVAAGLGLPAEEVVGRGTGLDDAGLRRKTDVLRTALERAGDRLDDPLESLAAVGSADLAATTAYLRTAARAGVPVLLDGLMALACALTAERWDPGVAAWCAAGHRSTEPAQSLALDKLGLEPLLDLGMRLGEGSGAVAAVPLVRAAAGVLAETALLAEVL